MTDVKAEIAGFVDRVLTNEAWAESGAEVATEVMRILTEAGWRAPSTQDETEWEWGRSHPKSTLVENFGSSRRDAENAVRPGAELVRRQAGPWVSVSSVEGDKP